MMVGVTFQEIEREMISAKLGHKIHEEMWAIASPMKQYFILMKIKKEP